MERDLKQTAVYRVRRMCLALDYYSIGAAIFALRQPKQLLFIRFMQFSPGSQSQFEDVIVGTDIVVTEVMSVFKQFLEDF